MISIEIDPKQQAAIQAALNVEPDKARRALLRTINKVLASVRSQGLRAIATAHDIPSSALRRRRRAAVVRASRANLSGLAWFGTVPVKAGYLGKPKQSRLGARAGRHSFEGAFVATVPGGHIGIFRRKENASRRTLGRPGTSSPNLPIVEQVVKLSAARAALAPIESGLPDQIAKVFQQEMNFERSRSKR